MRGCGPTMSPLEVERLATMLCAMVKTSLSGPTRSAGTSAGGGIGVAENTEYKGALSSESACARVPYSQLVVNQNYERIVSTPQKILAYVLHLLQVSD